MRLSPIDSTPILTHAPRSPFSNSGGKRRSNKETYPYEAADGTLSFQVVRHKRNKFYSRRPDGKGKFINGLGDVERMPYRLPELLAAPKKDYVFIVEGEKDVDRMRKEGLVATTNPGGPGNWRQEFNKHFIGREVVIIPDNDVVGRKHAYRVAGSLTSDKESAPFLVKVVRLPGLPESGDISDYFDSGGTVEQLMKLILHAPEYEKGILNTANLAYEITFDHYFAKDSGSRLASYREGVYHPNGEGIIRRRVKEVVNELGLDSQWRSNMAEEVIKYLIANARTLMEMPPQDQINLTNGILDISDVNNPILKPHTSDFHTQIQLPVSYDPDAKCPCIHRFISQVFPKDAHALAYEIIGVSMVPGLGIEKAILLVGEGGTGKSTFLDLLTEFVGRSQVSNLSLQKLENDRFATSRLVGKLLNVCADLPAKRLVSSAVFKQITGGDFIEGEYKFKSGFSFKPITRLIFSANDYPSSVEVNEAFFERWLTLPFDNKFRGTNEETPKSQLMAQLTSASEMSGLLNEALKGLGRFMTRGNRYDTPESMKSAHEEFRQTTDSLLIWLDANIELKSDEYVLKSELCKAFREDSDKNRRPIKSDRAFGREIRRLRPDLFNDESEAQRTVDEKPRQWVWEGIKLKKEEWF